MDNGASSYRRFLEGDDNGIVEINLNSIRRDFAMKDYEEMAKSVQIIISENVPAIRPTKLH